MVFRSTHGILVAGLILIGCGSRTPLWEMGASAAGTGGTGTSGAGGSLGGSGGSTGGAGGATGGTGGIGGAGGIGGTGGSGGVSPTCQGLAFDEDTLAFDANPAVIQYLPMFAPVDEAGSRLAVGVVEMPVESPGPVPGRLRLAAFDPWSSFSQLSLGAGTTPNFVVGVDQVAMDRGATGDTLAIAYPHNPAPPAADSSGLFLAEVTPDSTVINEPMDLTTSAADSHRVRFVRRGLQGHLVGLAYGTAGNHGLDISFVNAQDQSVSTYPRVGCATGTMVADAAPSSDGFIFAYSSSRETFGCLNDDDTDGPPNRINVGVYNTSFGFFTDVPIGYSSDDVVQFVRLVPHPEGTWLVFQYAGINAEVPPPIEVLLFSDEGDVIDGFSLPHVGDRYHVPGVAGLGRQLVFAWPELMDPGPMAGNVAIVGAGGETFSTVFYPKSGTPFSASMSVMGAPAGDQFVVGWSEFGADSPMVIRARIARFLCVELHEGQSRD